MINYHSDPLFWQRCLGSAGFYHGSLDGQFGQESEAAAKAFEARSAEIARNTTVFDTRTESIIQTLQRVAQLKARVFLREVIAKLPANGLVFKVISGTRTYEEQNRLSTQYRRLTGKIGPIIRGGFSNHNFGIAWDIGIFKNGQYIEESASYKSAGAIGKQQGLEWGGDWETFTDEPRFQVVREANLAGIRIAFEAGSNFIT
jgi:peptidoglycan LD-endopeptidase CwlK